MNKGFFLKAVLGLSVLSMISCADGNSDVTPEVISDAYIYQTVGDDDMTIDMVHAYSYSNVALASSTVDTPEGRELSMVPYMNSNYTYTIDEDDQMVDEIMYTIGDYSFTTELESGEILSTTDQLGYITANSFEINECSVSSSSVSLVFSESVDAGAYIILFENAEGAIIYSSGYALPTLSDDTFIGSELTIQEDADGWYSAGPSSVETVKVMAIVFEDEDSPSEFALQAVLEIESGVSVSVE